MTNATFSFWRTCALGGGLLGCWGCDLPDQGLPPPTPVAQSTTELRDVAGRVVDRSGRPVAGAAIRVLGYHADVIERTATSDDGGYFLVANLVDANSLLSVTAAGFYPEVIPVYLQGRATTLDLEPLALVRKRAGRARLWIAGDTMFGRRFEDRDEDGTPGEEGDLIRAGTQAEDAYDLFRYLLPVLDSADYRVANFESPASTGEASRHPFKQYSFTSHPDTLDGLRRAGIDAVSLGNNHSYDYLEPGREQTERALRDRGIAFFGSGASETEALGSVLDVDVGGLELSFQGYNGIKPGTYYPDPNQPWPHEFLYYATDDPRKGGSLLLSDDNVLEFLGKTAGRMSIPVMHGGVEYGTMPTGPMRDRFELAHGGGAKLVVAHHPHTVYGVALWGDKLEPSVSLLSLGNFIFDQDVFETFNSFMAIVDVDREGDRYHVEHLRLMPFHQENYRPSLISGEQAEWLARHVGHVSTYLPERAEDDLRPAVAFRDAAGIGVMLRADDYRAIPTSASREVTLEDGESPILPLHPSGASADYFTGYSGAPAEARLRVATDRLIFGDFEDYDVDDTLGENDHWWQTSTRYPTADQAHSGRNSIALYREKGSTSPVNTQLRNRITFDDDERLTLSCFFKGDNAGSVEVVAQYIERGTRRQIGEQTLHEAPGGTHDWQSWDAALSPTSGAGHLRFVITMQAPTRDEGGILYVDDCKLLSWGPSLAPGDTLPTPHEYAWGRFEAAGLSDFRYDEHRVRYERNLPND